MRSVRLLAPVVCSLLLGGCQDGTRDQLENEMMLMQERLVELETQVADSQEQATRLTAAVSQLEAHVRDVEMEVVDLSAHVSRDLLVDVEAIVGQAKLKMDEVRMRADALEAALRPSYVEE